MLKDKNFLRELEALNKKYAQNLAPRIEKMRSSLVAYSEDDDRSHLKDLAMELHSMAGSAKTFGFAETSALAKKYENHVKDFLDGQTGKQILNVEQWLKFIDKLKKTAESK